MPAENAWNSDAPHSHRRWIAIGAAVFLIAQSLIPLRYYLAPSPDERFAWRMFSVSNRRDCVATLYQTFTINGRLVEEQVAPIMLTPWQNLLNRNRPAAVEKLMKACCLAPDVVSVRFILTCGAADDPSHSEQQWVMDRRDLRIRQIDSISP